MHRKNENIGLKNNMSANMKNKMFELAADEGNIRICTCFILDQTENWLSRSCSPTDALIKQFICCTYCSIFLKNK